MSAIAALCTLAISALMLVGACCLCFTKRHTRTSTHYGGIGRIREMGEIVAMRLDCTDSGWAREPSGWLGRGRCLLINSEIVIEYRFDVRRAIITRDDTGVEVRLPPCEVTIHHGTIDVVFMQHGTILGMPLCRLDEGDISRLIAEARTNVTSKRQHADDALLVRARESVRTLLLDYARVIALMESVSVSFSGEPAAMEAVTTLPLRSGIMPTLASAASLLNLSQPTSRTLELAETIHSCA